MVVESQSSFMHVRSRLVNTAAIRGLSGATFASRSTREANLTTSCGLECIFGNDLIPEFAWNQPDGRLVRFVAEKIIDSREVEIRLSGVGRLERTIFKSRRSGGGAGGRTKGHF